MLGLNRSYSANTYATNLKTKIFQRNLIVTNGSAVNCDHVTSILHSDWLEFYCIYIYVYIYMYFRIILTQFYINFSR